MALDKRLMILVIKPSYLLKKVEKRFVLKLKFTLDQLLTSVSEKLFCWGHCLCDHFQGDATLKSVAICFLRSQYVFPWSQILWSLIDILCFNREIPYLVREWSASANSSILNSVVMFTFRIFRLKLPFFENAQKSKITCLK